MRFLKHSLILLFILIGLKGVCVKGSSNGDKIMIHEQEVYIPAKFDNVPLMINVELNHPFLPQLSKSCNRFGIFRDVCDKIEKEIKKLVTLSSTGSLIDIPSFGYLNLKNVLYFHLDDINLNELSVKWQEEDPKEYARMYCRKTSMKEGFRHAIDEKNCLIQIYKLQNYFLSKFKKKAFMMEDMISQPKLRSHYDLNSKITHTQKPSSSIITNNQLEISIKKDLESCDAKDVSTEVHTEYKFIGVEWIILLPGLLLFFLRIILLKNGSILKTRPKATIQESIMALKIQRMWKEYQCRKLIHLKKEIDKKEWSSWEMLKRIYVRQLLQKHAAQKIQNFFRQLWNIRRLQTKIALVAIYGAYRIAQRIILPGFENVEKAIQQRKQASDCLQKAWQKKYHDTLKDDSKTHLIPRAA